MSGLVQRRGPAGTAARRRRLLAHAVWLAVTASVTGCAANSDGGPRAEVVVTANILGDVVNELAGDVAQVTTLMKPNADPHSFEISAQEAAQLADADLVVSNGLGLEAGVEQHLEAAAAQGAPRFVAGTHIDALSYTGEASGPDPHFWTDPARMLDVIDALEERLLEIDAIDAAAVTQNAVAYRAELEVLETEMTAAFATIPDGRRALVTNHHVFGYLAERFDFEVIGAAVPGGTTLASPSAADLAELTDAIEQHGVPAIFAESSQPDRLMQVLSSEAGVEVDVIELFTESLTAPGDAADTYLAMMRENTSRITTGLTP